MAQIKLNLEPSIRGNLNYKPGEVLKGFAELHVQEPGRYHSFAIYISGHVITQIFINNILSRGSEVILNKQIVGFFHIQPLQIPIGVYRYGFRYQLPDNLPCSFLFQHFGRNNSIEYTIKAILTAPGQPFKEACIQLGMLKELDLNSHPSLIFGQNRHKILDFYPFLCKKDRISFFATISVSGFAVGKKITVDVLYINRSIYRLLGTQIRLIQKIEIRVAKSVFPAVQTENTIWKKVFEIDGKQGKEINAKYLIDVPEEICVSIDHICNLIKVKYYLEVEPLIAFCGFRCKLDSHQCISFPITIGSKELLSQEYIDSEFRPSAPSCSQAASLNDITEREDLVPSAPNYLDIITNNQQSNQVDYSTDEDTERPKTPCSLILNMDGSKDIIMNRNIELNKSDTECRQFTSV